MQRSGRKLTVFHIHADQQSGLSARGSGGVLMVHDGRGNLVADRLVSETFVRVSRSRSDDGRGRHCLGPQVDGWSTSERNKLGGIRGNQ